MRFEEWEPVYEAILDDFGYPRSGDEEARDFLAANTRGFDWSTLDHVAGSSVAIAGGAGTLGDELGVVESAGVVVAASNAAATIRDAGLDVDLMTTDLDKVPETAVALSRAGTPVAVHAHGDNLSALQRWLPEFDLEFVLPTTQAAPVAPVENVGGFTDGDRGAFLADHLGAATLRFPGWDFDDSTASPAKLKKLEWAERLLLWLETRRGDRFDLLDGRRDAIEPILG
jgi:uncharacterized Rossmann fold enzyme